MGQRLFAISSLRSANRNSGDKFKCAKSRDFRPLLPSLGKSLRRQECVAEAGGFDLDMANSKSDSLARSRRIAEPHPARIHKPLETFEFREPYQICRVRSFGEKRAFWRRMSQFCRIEVRGRTGNHCCYWPNLQTSSRGEYTASAKLAEGEGFELAVREGHQKRPRQNATNAQMR